MRTYVGPDLIGKRYGRLVIKGIVGRIPPTGRNAVLCQCDCGNEATVVFVSLNSKNTSSCGCLHRQTLGKNGRKNKVHGDSGVNITPEYVCWRSMRQRCQDPSNKSFRNYGGRGISVCQEWDLSYERFLADMGRKPTSRHSLDRYPDKDGDYKPGNCRWATMKEQNSNKRTNCLITIGGRTMISSDWAAQLKISRGTLKARLSKGWDPASAATPPRPRGMA